MHGSFLCHFHFMCCRCRVQGSVQAKKKFSILSKHRAYLSILAAHNLHGVSPLKKLDCALRPQKFGSITSFASWKRLLAGVDTMLFSSFAVLLVLQFSIISPHQFTQFSVPLIIRELKGEQEQLCLQTWEDCNVPCIQTGTVLMLVITKDKFCQLYIKKPCALLCFAEYIYQSTKIEWHHCRRFWIVKATHAWFVFSFSPFLFTRWPNFCYPT